MRITAKQFGIIALVGIIGFSQAACAKVQRNNPESDFEARPIESGKSVEITEYVGDSWEVRIPPRIQNLPVTHIGEKALENKNLVSVTIPNSVASIGNGAFQRNQLTNITIPSSVIYLSGFDDNQLTSITIPNSVTSIGKYAFAGNQLTCITIGAGVDIGFIMAFDNNFPKFYEDNNRRAGTYTLANNQWSFKP